MKTKRKASAHPKIVSPKQWRTARLLHLRHEKELTRHSDRVAAERRRLPMTRVEKEYRFDGPDGESTLLGLFAGRQQLIVYHFMFDPSWTQGCSGCTSQIDSIGDLSPLDERSARFVLVSRAPLKKLEAYRKKKGWKHPWFSSFGSDFNYDFHATLDEKIAPLEYNYRTKKEMLARGEANPPSGEAHGNSVFFRIGQEVYHTYSSYARGSEGRAEAFGLLDITPFGRQQEWEKSPPGWPQRPTYG